MVQVLTYELIIAGNREILQKKKKFVEKCVVKKNTIYETARTRDILFDKTLFNAFRERYVRAHI